VLSSHEIRSVSRFFTVQREIMTAIRQRWSRSAAVVATGVAALVGTGIFVATPASAHKPGFEVECSSVTINLNNYNEHVQNLVSLEADGKPLIKQEKFGREFNKKVELPAHKKPIAVHFVVNAGDDGKFSRDETKMAPACEEAPSPSPSESEEAPAPEPSNAPEPAGGGDDLAETGSSSATPMIAGAAGVVLVAGAGLVVVSRKRRSTQD
jgi:LPXTG-motif cell wall-anchored protein